MNIFSIVGAFIITFTLLSYGIGSISIMRFKLITRGVLIFLTLGLVFDFTAVSFMIAGSDNLTFSLHIIVGASAVLLMMINVILIWREYLIKGLNKEISKPLVKYTRYAYFWWLIVYITESFLVLWL